MRGLCYPGSTSAHSDISGATVASIDGRMKLILPELQYSVVALSRVVTSVGGGGI